MAAIANTDGGRIVSSFLYSRTRGRRGYILLLNPGRLPCPRVLPKGHTTQRARGEIFKLSLSHGNESRAIPASESLLAAVTVSLTC